METVNSSQTFVISSDDAQSISRHFAVEGETSLVLLIEGNKKIDLELEVSAAQDSRMTFLLINHNGEAVNLRDSYHLSGGSDSVIAYCQLNDYPLEADSEYHLDGQGAVLKVQNAAMTSNEKTFRQNTLHSERNTTANINNYGIAMKGGSCDFDVRNRINKGCHGSETHQTSRILTYDAQSKGRILPVLYIDDNDVRASHAATMGQPDRDQIFYMQTRGLSYQEAMKLITVGYLLPVSEVIDDEKTNSLLRQEIETKVSECLS
ncbi:MAG: SufD family Fe-S cluster assembly protein [Erysipelotrichaceae bacterium]|nr:SufD family Fe-S cluster assembly protein [Erysipelotrichaceae bacterium]